MGTLIIGGGAAGLAAAAFSKRPARVLERLAAPGRKLLATGGGRCNLTHDARPETLAAAFGDHARFTLPVLRAFPPERLRAFFSTWGVETLAEPDGCVFPVAQKASAVLDALLRAARANGAELLCDTRALRLVTAPGPDGQPRVTAVETSRGTLQADRVILAAGGRSYPALGSDGSGFTLAAEAGLALTPPVPALAGLLTEEAWPHALAGLVCERASLRLDLPDAPRPLVEGPLLFTHKGLSGPPALALAGTLNARLASSAAALPVRAAFLPERDAAAWQALFSRWRATHGGRALHNLLAGELPRGLAAALCDLAGASDTPASRASRTTLRTLAETCSGAVLHVTGTEGWDRAMATRGGVALDELDPKTLACRRLPGLRCAGEVIDVDAPCGGYNLTWAFASGRLAATAP